MRLVSVQVGLPQRLGTKGAEEPFEREWKTGYGKAPVRGPCYCGRLNLEGDGQGNLDLHGGPDMAVLAYSADHYARWQGELQGRELGPGAFAENLTVAGADEESVCLGDVWAVGTVRLEVSEPRKPCRSISRFHRRQELLKQVVATGRHGWYLRVLQEGTLEAGDEVQLVSRPHPDWTVARAMRVRLSQARDPASAALLAALPVLGADWRERLQRSG